MAGNHLPGLGAFHDHSPLVFRKGKHDGENEIAREGVFDQPHVEDVDADATVKEVSDGLNSLNCGSCETIRLFL